MKALIVINIDENHLLKETNELYDRLKGYKCELRPMPKKKLVLEHRIGNLIANRYELTEAKGYNDCLKEILGETE